MWKTEAVKCWANGNWYGMVLKEKGTEKRK